MRCWTGVSAPCRRRDEETTPHGWRSCSRPAGHLVGVFAYGYASDSLPFSMTEVQSAELFRTRFELLRSETLPRSLPLFDDMEERWQEWRLA